MSPDTLAESSSGNAGCAKLSLPPTLMQAVHVGVFVITTPVMYTCLDLQHRMIPLASAIMTTVLSSTDSAAGLILTLATRNDINTLADLAGKVVASANPMYQEGVHFQMGVMQDAGVSLLQGPLQVSDW